MLSLVLWSMLRYWLINAMSGLRTPLIPISVRIIKMEFLRTMLPGTHQSLMVPDLLKIHRTPVMRGSATPVCPNASSINATNSTSSEIVRSPVRSRRKSCLKHAKRNSRRTFQTRRFLRPPGLVPSWTAVQRRTHQKCLLKAHSLCGLVFSNFP